ncbi:hypothetical protein [Aureliella helgolandensis]|uniref:hypothetical protein n=1 Tax=Aureliella helgolandensis TaxID=2527968 RepID=UPI0011A9B68D|nr:hypothetical protein [Aureliella helgolandensis]
MPPDVVWVTINGRNVEMHSGEDHWLVSSASLNDEATKQVVVVGLTQGTKPVQWLDAMIRESEQ